MTLRAFQVLDSNITEEPFYIHINQGQDSDILDQVINLIATQRFMLAVPSRKMIVLMRGLRF